MRLLIQHRSRYGYPEPASLGPHLVRLRPATHTRARVEAYSLIVEQPCEVRWQQDPYGNHVARLTFEGGERLASLDLLVELAVDIQPVNPFDFFVDDRCETVPFVYPDEVRSDLRPFLDREDLSLRGGPLLEEFLEALPHQGRTVDFLVGLTSTVNQRIRYVIREEPGVWTPEETLGAGRGSCRDSAVLLIAALRSRGLAARFVSGYLVQLTDEGLIPDQPKGVDRDVVDLHAWAEVYLPGAGWIGLDGTSGLLCGEGHIPLACTASPALAAPIEGTSSVGANEVSFQTSVGRLGHEPSPTAPYAEETFAALRAAGEQVDRHLEKAGVVLTIGGEPTFNSRLHPEAEEWNGAALGPTKWEQGWQFAQELRRCLCPGGVTLFRSGKWYPGESLPRWAIDLLGAADGTVLWEDLPGLAGAENGAVRRIAEALSARLGLGDHLLPAFEDPWFQLREEARLPVEVDPLEADLDDPEERRRLARLLGRGLAREAGFVLPLGRRDDGWASDRWRFRRERLYLLPGDSPIGLRLPLDSLLPGEPPPPEFPDEDSVPPDPRRAKHKDDPKQIPEPIRTALCVEERKGLVHVFLPPLPRKADFLLLLEAVDAVRRECGIEIRLEGYPPPSSSDFVRVSVTPDPGVLEVNLPPADNLRDHGQRLELVFDAALRSGLHTEKYLLDGRLSGSGGGNHLTLGGPRPLESPFLRRPDLLASLITFFQHHPSLSYLFTGLFVGPTSQAPRLDETRLDALAEMEMALDRAFAESDGEPPVWFSDRLFRDLLVDLTGNTHRAEICIDKLFDPVSPAGRQGLVELRAFEMPPHIRMAEAQMILVRALVASFVDQPYRGPLVRWGRALHDRFLLPYYLWLDFEGVLDELKRRDLPLPADGYRPFVELRCPLVGRLQAGDVTLEVRNAIEPWPVLGEEVAAGGTSRYVDSSVERIEVRADGLVPERHRVLVNGIVLPLKPTEQDGLFVGGVRFRAWAPPRSLQGHLGIHHPVRFDVLDTWGKRSLGACAYHVWHPEGRSFNTPPLTRVEAAARRAQRFTVESHLPWPVREVEVPVDGSAPYTLDLRRFPGDRPQPEAPPDDDDEGAPPAVADDGSPA